MLEEAARIIQLNNSHAWVETKTQHGCERCAAGRGCGAGTLSQALANSDLTPVRVRLNSDLTAAALREGDIVLVGMDERAVVNGSLALYMLPLIAMLAMALIAAQVTRHEGLIILASGAGLAAGLWLVRQFSQRAEHNPQYEPVAVKQLPATAWYGCTN